MLAPLGIVHERFSIWAQFTVEWCVSQLLDIGQNCRKLIGQLSSRFFLWNATTIDEFRIALQTPQRRRHQPKQMCEVIAKIIHHASVMHGIERWPIRLPIVENRHYRFFVSTGTCLRINHLSGASMSIPFSWLMFIVFGVRWIAIKVHNQAVQLVHYNSSGWCRRTDCIYIDSHNAMFSCCCFFHLSLVGPLSADKSMTDAPWQPNRSNDLINYSKCISRIMIEEWMPIAEWKLSIELRQENWYADSVFLTIVIL